MFRKIIFSFFLFFPALAHADKLGSLNVNSDILLTTQTASSLSYPVISSANASGTFSANNTYENHNTLTLASGTWIVSAQMFTSPNGAGTFSQENLAISVNSGNTQTDHVLGVNLVSDGVGVTTNHTLQIVSYTLTLGSSTTIYEKGLAAFGSGNPAWNDYIIAYRPPQ